MPRRDAQLLAGAVREHSRRQAHRHGRPIASGTVLSRSGPPGDPVLSVELDDSRTVLAPGDLDLTQAIRGGDEAQRIEVDDQLLLAELGSGDWTVLDVLNPALPAPEYGGGGAWGYLVPDGVVARIAEGQYGFIVGGEIVIDGVLEVEGRLVELDV